MHRPNEATNEGAAPVGHNTSIEGDLQSGLDNELAQHRQEQRESEPVVRDMKHRMVQQPEEVSQDWKESSLHESSGTLQRVKQQRQWEISSHVPSTSRAASTSSTTASRALSETQILDCLAYNVSRELLTSGREARQAQLRRMTLVSKAWLEPFSKQLWRNPYFGTGQRAGALHTCLGLYPKRGKLIQKLIFGEGSSTDVTDWPTLQTVPDILKAATEVRIVGFDGLKNVDLEQFREVFVSRKHLEELRACDLMPEPWCYAGHLFDNLIGPSEKLVRLRLYNIYSECADQGSHSSVSSSSSGASSNSSFDMSTPPLPVTRGFTRVALNHCAIGMSAMRNIFGNSATTLEELYLELPMNMPDSDLCDLVRLVGQGLKHLNIQGYSQQLAGGPMPRQGHVVDDVLSCTPNLQVLNFPEAHISHEGIHSLAGSKLRLWSFACPAEVRPSHWIEAFADPRFPSPASCRVYVKGWTLSEIRHVRIEAFKIGVNWLTSGATLTDMTEVDE